MLETYSPAMRQPFEGLHEDAVAYSDNPYHQWNGLTEEGLPDFLRGADYIKTFNHYRYLRVFKMTVEFTRPANSICVC